ncbi:DUF19 domain-containing protein [Caenorhabditis elegans]|uniref:DUF19 domain-containing protein n=1 Tax=Caenorhabditis elegans TaxID=6239 RepID=A0FLS3_CAEEL|nr:DUF19 domain-containing protein [Caenorhabditis elegans]CAL63987.1 DUF19 domain-containing protein [Caenorhabditis elegans]|eukprot:NP_001076659.1 Uncharacterized protein CELE_C08F11.17 [Caenorhabditis elegans]
MFGLAFTCLTVLVTVAAAGGCSAPSNIVSETFSSAKQCFLDYSNDAYLYGCGVTASWVFSTTSECFVSEYYKNKYNYVGAVSAKYNGSTICTKTPCGAVIKVQSNCSQAFYDRINKIPSDDYENEC